jgi:CelD/BcsL family acetyltransferase involved in cellulose biosynthesis
MQIKVIRDLAGILELKAQWDELYSYTKPSLFAHHSWVYHNYKNFDSSEILLLAVYGDRKVLTGVFPFAIKELSIKKMTFKVLSHGGSALTDYSSFIVDQGSNRRLMMKRILEKLIELQQSNWEFYKIDNLSDADDNANVFRDLAEKMLYACSIAIDITPKISYQYGYEEAKKISNIKRRFSKISEGSKISHKVGAEIDENIMRDFSVLQQQAYPGSGFGSKQAQTFYSALLHDADFCDHIILSSLEQGDTLLAAHFGFVDADKFYYYVPTYNSDFAQYGVGQYLLWRLIDRAKEESKREFDFLRGAESYKYNWMNEVSTNYTFFGAAPDASFFRKLIVNLWSLKKTIPFFIR